jgi:thymidylate synthase ThyX
MITSVKFPMKRVLTVGPMPPEKCAYALARYSRSPDSIKDSIAWVRTHDSRKFLESFYFQYGHASIADLGHLVVCFEGISEVAATEIEDEQLWDGQARSSRYQDFSKSGFVTPPGLSGEQAELYSAGARGLLDAYRKVHEQVVEHLKNKLPRPEDMKPDAYARNIAARAFDVARYLLFLGIPTGVGQVVSIRTLERQVRRLKASEYPELQELAAELADACAEPAACAWDERDTEAVAPTLAKYVNADEHARQSRADLRQWAAQNLPALPPQTRDVDLLRPSHPEAEMVATLLYPACDRPFRALYELAQGWSEAQRREVIDVALRSRTRRDELLRQFRTATFVYDIVMDIGAYRDLHRHRRCQQFRQPYSFALGHETPDTIREAGLEADFAAAMDAARAVHAQLPGPAREYIVPFGARSRFLFKMDFAEAEYIARLRSGVKGHFSYRRIAWEMKRRMDELEPALGRLIEATPPEIEDPLTR